MSDLLHDMVQGVPEARPQSAVHSTRPFYWSIRRELWENRATYLAPAIVAGVLLLGSVLAALRFAHHHSDVSQMPPAQRLGLLQLPYAIAALAIVATMLIVAVFYCLGALYNERRDRSILFWKSLPVSDLTAVLSKLAIPMIVMPLAAFVVIEVLEVALFALNSLAAVQDGNELASWTKLPFLQIQAVVIYLIVVVSLWLAPFYAWLLFISGWAKRAPFLWAFLPPLALSLVEKVAFNTTYLADVLQYRINGFKDAFSDQAGQLGVIANPASLIDPVRLIALPGLWSGLVAGAALVAAAIWFRRRREPI